MEMEQLRDQLAQELNVQDPVTRRRFSELYFGALREEENNAGLIAHMNENIIEGGKPGK